MSTRRRHSLKQMAVAFLSIVPEREAQEDLLTAASRVRALRPFVVAVDRLREDRGIAKRLTLTTAIPLSSKDRQVMRSRMEAFWGMPVFFTEVVDTSLMGGWLIQAEDWEEDASIRGRLHRLKHAFITS